MGALLESLAAGFDSDAPWRREALDAEMAFKPQNSIILDEFSYVISRDLDINWPSNLRR